MLIMFKKASLFSKTKTNDEDFYKTDITMYCVCLVELNKVSELYYVAQKLANSCSDKHISWFAVVYLHLI
jgi:hypothetical protein